MACEMCARNAHCCQLDGLQNCDAHHYSDFGVIRNPVDEEPVAPTLSLGNRILWLTEFRAASGIIRWIGRIPSISSSWSAGIEFDNIMPGGCSGEFRGRTYFHSRPGHALFLPVADLIKVDDSGTAGNGERSSFFGRLQDSYSNFAQRRRRDSTFGHFKQDYCSSCDQNEFPYYSHYCRHAPVYDRITTRRSLCYDDHPYEMYNACVPCSATSNSSNHSQAERNHKFVHEIHPESHVVDNCLKTSSLRSAARNGYFEYPDNELGKVNTFRKYSMFNPRSSLRFINGFKEWMSVVLGTSRQKRKRKVIFKNQKLITSVFLSQNSHSVTGQRLSSFNEYSSINLCKSAKQDEPSTGSKPSCSRKSVENSSNIPLPKRGYRKKKPAPLPPVQSSGSSTHADGKQKQYHRTENEGIGIVREEYFKGEDNHVKVMRPNSNYSVLVKKHRRKKRRAPLPPPLAMVNSLKSATKSLPEESHNIQNLNFSFEKFATDTKRNEQRVKSRKCESAKQIYSQVNPKTKLKSKIMHQNLRNRSISSEFDTMGESDMDDLENSGSISFSEEESGEEKYGLVKCKVVRNTDFSDKSGNLPSTSNYVKYVNDDNDVCLKILIKKTETNVVTVEEVPAPHTVHYTVEEDTSTELSDEPDDIAAGKLPQCEKSNISQNCEPKQNSTVNLSAASDEVPDESKTIFEELQIKPPVKGSVKDFVNAFNMLAIKGAVIDAPEKKNNNYSIISRTQNHKSAEVNNRNNVIKSIQSFPTKWEYQTNKVNNLGLASNKFLLPIVEESHNETSEHDGNVSVDDSQQSKLEVECKSSNPDAIETDRVSGINESCAQNYSHFSKEHTADIKEDCFPKGKKKIIFPGQENIIYNSCKSLNRNCASTRASLAALSSLLQEKERTSKSEGSDKNSPKLDQPIMVGLYIEDKSTHRGPIPLLIKPSMSLRKLKKQIEKEYEFPMHQQCWILGESFAVVEEASLASYGVIESGCPILLYVMSKDSKCNSLSSRTSSLFRPKSVQDSSDSSDEELSKSSRKYKKGSLKDKQNTNKKKGSTGHSQNPSKADDKHCHSSQRKAPSRSAHHKHKDARKNKSEYHKAWEVEYEKKTDYRTLLALDDVDLVANMEKLECPICFLDIDAGEGVTLQECLHSFCRECLAGAIQFSETAVVKCPFRNDEYSCESHLQEREIKSLVSSDLYERHLQKSMALAESQAQDSFHCKTPDCPGWCLFEDNVNTFLCPVCKHTNCLTCAAIHEGKNCRQYQDDVAFRCDSSEEARKTKEYLQNMVENGEAMRCPQCQVILMKKWGCDWLKCSMCHTEVCWVTKGPRWGPEGRGDTSGGCKCMVNGVRCHPKCSYCH